MNLDLILLAATLGLLICSAFFSGSETALFALSPQQRHQLALRGDARARGVTDLLDRLRTVLVSLLIGNTFVNILIAVLATRLCIRRFGPEQGPLISGIGVTALLLLGGEILPKSIAVRSPESFSLRVATPLRRLVRLMDRPTLGLRRLNRALLVLLDRLWPGDDLVMREDEMLALISIGEEDGSIGARERRLVEGVFELGDARVADVMTPRVDLFMLPAEMDSVEAGAALRRAGRSFAPIFRETPDRIVGFAAANALLGAEAGQSVDDLGAEILFCPESRRAGSLLLELLEREVPLALVLDEYGATAGLVTLTDLFAVLAGEIRESRDSESLRYTMPTPDTLVASSRLPLSRARELLAVALESEAMETLGGYFMERLGEVPVPGEQHELDGLRWTLLSARGPVLGSLRVERLR